MSTPKLSCNLNDRSQYIQTEQKNFQPKSQASAKKTISKKRTIPGRSGWGPLGPRAWWLALPVRWARSSQSPYPPKPASAVISFLLARPLLRSVQR